MTPGDHTVTLKVSVWSAWDDAGSPVGDPVDIETTTTVVHVTGTAPIAGFEIQHANFNNRTKQYLYIQIPTGNRTSSYDLVLSLIDTTASTTTVLLTKNNPGTEEIWLFDHTGLTVWP